MQFRISDTFTDSLTRLTAEEQKAVKITAFDLQQNPANPGMQLHRIEKSKDKHFWSARLDCDSRLIIHKFRLHLSLWSTFLAKLLEIKPALTSQFRNTKTHLDIRHEIPRNSPNASLHS